MNVNSMHYKKANEYENGAMLTISSKHTPAEGAKDQAPPKQYVTKEYKESRDRNEVWLWPDRKIIYVIQIEPLKAFIDRRHRFSLCLHFYLA